MMLDFSLWLIDLEIYVLYSLYFSKYLKCFQIKKYVSIIDNTEILLQFATILIFKKLWKPFHGSMVNANASVPFIF